MSRLILLHFVNLFFAGMLAGIETAVHYGLGAPPKALSEQSQIQLRQVLVLKLRVLVPVFFIPTLASAIALTAIDGSAPGVWLRYTGLLALLVWIVIRVIRTVPINSATLTWNPDAPPKDWRVQVETSERFHVLGVCASVVAFVCFMAAMAAGLSVPL
jgi:Domain of unknown function (DUF1772)